ncbi:hypothetical protein JZ751_003814 [Albula glossodonta]|uniref:Uncharacterized protein n=1 Tax=Albula glossodonta TaxID=121402 RepID=A0A8T2P687_9TELE|nr:hypothetical protein JZ751_003814 [Albula glossodonta]
MFMNDSVSITEMGTGQYGTAKGIATSDLITTVTPEKKAEEEKAEKEDEEKTKASELSEGSEPVPSTPVRHEMKEVQLGVLMNPVLSGEQSLREPSDQ